ncbi:MULTISPECIES: alpha/beta hydrolase family protein [unclassified Caulobacter]|uniref:alpha/beta hydrolase family protein n=1 Tax=unclassified Caulobacter TaxID=2648921 RepID=UPI000D39699C|nr:MULTISPECIES: S9 family peptidase [unclassified Caulobacter]PTS87978.1 peptidase S9 [Caulobacter sp. HMWF009]PTT08961.1 peptidase S9 [Caulobacter sp. HMWF025]
MHLAAMAACLAMLVAAPASHAATEKTPLAAYGGLPNIEQLEISPDGTKLAVVVTNQENRAIVVRGTAEDSKPERVLLFDNHKLRSVRWAGQDHLLITTSQVVETLRFEGPKREYLMAFDYNLVTGKQTKLMTKLPGTLSVVLGPPEVRIIDGAPYALVEGINVEDVQGRNSLFRINLETGFTSKIDIGGDVDTDDWQVGPDGTPMGQTLYNEKRQAWTLKVRDEADFNIVERATLPMGSRQIEGLGRDGRSVVVWVDDPANPDQTILREYRADGSKTDVPGSAAFEGLIFAPGDSRLIGGVRQAGDVAAYEFFDPRDQAAWQTVLKAFPGDQVALTSWSDDRRKVVVMVDSPMVGPAYALVDLNTKSARWLGDIYRGLHSDSVSEVRPVRYKAADGLEINGYLTLPKGRDPKNLPLIVFPHGGPEGRDVLGFDWQAQALASRGYAVLQPNFRGSEGYGRAFLEAGFGQWGKKMQTDLSDGVRDLAAQGIIDPKRVCIVGGSYGGYAALAGATIDTGVYRCAVSIAGPSDLKRFLDYTGSRYDGPNSALRYWLRFMGADGVRDPDLATLSPARLADRASIPILLIHGKDDTVVPYDQSQVMAAALKRAGRPVEIVTLDGEDHWLSRGATRLTMLTATVDFLEKHNPPD